MNDAWFSDEAFWREGYRFMFSDEAFTAAREQVDRIVSLTGVTSGLVLDLGCGPARHAVPLALKGFQVTGVDASPFLLEKARAHADAARTHIEFVQADMREFDRPETFDLAISMFSSFGYFAERADDRRVAANLYRNLRPGGVALIDVMSKEITGGRYQESIVGEVDGVTRVERHRIVDNWTRIRSDWMLIEGDSVRRFEFCVRVYSGQELVDLLEQVGFAQVSLYGDLQGRPYGPGAARLIAVARKS